MNEPRCRFCGAELSVVFADLGMSPPSNAFLDETSLTKMEPFYPLKAFVCERCFLVQLEEFESPENIFSDYVYFSSYSTSWLEHCRRYAERMVEELSLRSGRQVVEIASNDGYLLQYFAALGVDVLGVEPAANVARTAIDKGIPTEIAFFGTETARRLRDRGIRADLIAANNVLAHVPDINDFVEGVRILLADRGTVTFEFPHLLELIENNQFDTIYHEHFSYLSATTVARILERHGLGIVRAESLPTHGGSLRIWAMHRDAAPELDGSRDRIFQIERDAGLDDLSTYQHFTARMEEVKRRLLEFLISVRGRGERIAAYGAAAKGTTLLNYCGIRTDFIDYIVDRNPYKQHKYLPGCHVPVYPVERIAETKPDYVLILPWNLRTEVAEQMADVRRWGGKFVVPIPKLEIF
jgi:2-polyprenyl-3-methyl-5-hydroxy-6-metoxy-1,4-benzoquinol methylase